MATGIAKAMTASAMPSQNLESVTSKTRSFHAKQQKSSAKSATSSFFKLKHLPL
nr:MAG TPA: hypothetical protein [Caudoviricetes sp.]